ncbi:glycosyltransferase, partial [Paracoccus liaowanqingii]
VHTYKGCDALVGWGIARDRITVIPHGPLPINLSFGIATHQQERDHRWTFVLFGRLQEYKGLDILIEALAEMPAAVRARMRVIVAGEPFYDVAAVQRRAMSLNVSDVVDWRLTRLTECEMASLFEEADSFIFPYRRIEASGVYYTVKGLGKWIVASDLGSFSEEISNEIGRLVPPADASALAAAMTDAVGKIPDLCKARGPSWDEIGVDLANLYNRLLDRRGFIK